MTTLKIPLHGAFLFVVFQTLTFAETKVELLKTPNTGIQPKVIVDTFGVAHLIYYKGDASSGNIFYCKRESGEDFTTPIQVNTIPGSAVSMGTIRGANFALDNDGRVHAVWNGSRSTKQDGQHGPPMFYTRSKEDGSGFEEQRIITGHWPVDGGGAIGIDSSSRVFVFWHSGEEGAGDSNRSIFAKISEDNGFSFDREKIISPKGTGVCGCCSMQTAVDRDENIYVVYRTARDGEHRDINLLLSQDNGKNFEDQIMDKWEVQACPMSSMSFGETDRHMLVGWETESKVRFAPLDKGILKKPKIQSPAEDGSKMKHPVFATSAKGEVLLVWTEGTGWKKGGNIGWRQFDSKMQPIGKVHRPNEDVPVWSFLAAYYDQKDDTFYVLH